MIVHVGLISGPGGGRKAINERLEASGLAGTRSAVIMLSKKASGVPLFSGLMGDALRLDYHEFLRGHAVMTRDFVMEQLHSVDATALLVVHSSGTAAHACAIAAVVRRYAGLPALVAASGVDADAAALELLASVFDRRKELREAKAAVKRENNRFG